MTNSMSSLVLDPSISINSEEAFLQDSSASKCLRILEEMFPLYFVAQV